MADISIDKAVEKDGAITVTGTGFTKTTTKVYLDGADTPFDVTSDSEIKVNGSGNAIYAVKGETQTPAATVEKSDNSTGSSTTGTEPYKTATPDHTPGDVTKDDQTADASVADLADAANSQSDPKQLTEERYADRAKTVQEQGIGPRDPYPTGSPPDPTQPATDNPQQYGAQPIKDDKPATGPAPEVIKE